MTTNTTNNSISITLELKEIEQLYYYLLLLLDLSGVNLIR